MNIVENGDMRNNRALETVNAAASVIAFDESRFSQPSIQKRRWHSFWSMYWCFGSQKSRKRFGHAVLVPELSLSVNGTAVAPENTTQPPSTRIPFVAPPSSPASFLFSDPPSALQSPAASVESNSLYPNIYSPIGPRSIFAIGPYAHETQLVTPPAFSTYTTEPSTAPFTPPPELVHLTTPSSPEVPFAKLLDPIHGNGDVGLWFPPLHYSFQSYHLHPGSPVGPLISPRSAVSGSGTSSPFPDPYFPDVRYGVPQKLFTVDMGPMLIWDSQQASGSVTPDAIQPKSRDSHVHLNRQDSVVSPLPNVSTGQRNNDLLIDHKVYVELTSEDVRSVEMKVLQNTDGRDHHTNELADDNAGSGTSGKGQTLEEGQQHQKQRSASLGSINEFNFDHANGLYLDKPCISSNWWANEKV